MKLLKIIGVTIVAIIIIVILIAISVGLNFGSIHIEGFLNKEKQNVETKIFRETQGYVQGKLQDLSKYYGEYTANTSTEDKQAIAAIIKTQFSDFNIDHIHNKTLKIFLINTRGY